MRFLSTVSLAVLLLSRLTLAQELPKAVAPCVNGETLGVLHVDVKSVDPKAIEAQLLSWMGQLNLEPRELEAAKREIAQARQIAEGWRDEFLKAGGRHVYLVTSLADIPTAPGVIIAPLEPNANAKTIASLMFSGQPNGPIEGGQVRRWPDKARIVDGAVILADADQVKRLEQKKDRPDLARALAAAGDTPVRAVLVISADMRKVAEETAPNLPRELGGGPITTVSRGVQWIAASVDPGAKPRVELQVQCSDAESAKAIRDILSKGIDALAQMKDVQREVPQLPALLKELLPELKQDKLVIAVDQARMDDLVKRMVVPMVAAARKQAIAVQTMSNARQLLMGGFMHAADNKNVWPDKLEALAPKYLPEQILGNPRMENAKNWVYIKPDPAAKQPASTIVLHEPLDAKFDMLIVGFADGHVEMMKPADLAARLKAQQGK